MTTNIIPLSQDYWERFEISDSDSEFLYNHLLEKEIPLSTESIAYSLIENRIETEKSRSETNKVKIEKLYKPADVYASGDVLIFPVFENIAGKVISTRAGINPEYPNLQVAEVELDDHSIRHFAFQCENHILNNEKAVNNSRVVNAENAMQEYGNYVVSKLSEYLSSNKDFVKIAGNWFPRSLVVDIHVGHLNLVEAVLEENNGGPLTTQSLMQQIDFNHDSNDKLLEFSFNLALQDDGRFDEVGPSGEILWCLKSGEPLDVQKTPELLIPVCAAVNNEKITALLQQFEGNISDEFESEHVGTDLPEIVSISLIYPHWRCGTLPLTPQLKSLFPTAYESERVRFDFIDADTNQRLQGWVVRVNNYVSGLKEWYLKHNLIPGSMVSLYKGERPGEIFIRAQKSRQNKEWLKTILIGTDQAIVFALLKQPVSVEFNDRMVYMVTDADSLDVVRSNILTRKEKLSRTIFKMARELSKLNPQGHVHAQELYAALNLVLRIPPSAVLDNILQESQISHLGDLYFRINDSPEDIAL